MIEILRLVIVLTLSVLGVLFVLLAAVGIVRMPDLYTRMQAASKAATLGVACVLIASAFYFEAAELTIRAVLITIFVFLTAPVAAHMIARAGYVADVPIADETEIDELKGQYDLKSGRLNTPDSKPKDENLQAPESSKPWREHHF